MGRLRPRAFRWHVAAVAAVTLGCGGANTPPSAQPAPRQQTQAAPPIPAAPEEDADGDGDNILDSRDECPAEREVYNAVDDEDGCPDTSIDYVYE